MALQTLNPMQTNPLSSPPTVNAPPAVETRIRPWQRYRRWLIWLPILLLVAWLGYVGIRSGLYAYDAYRAGQRLMAEISNGPFLVALATERADVDEIATALENLDGQMGALAPILHGLGWLPRYGPTLAAAPKLLTAAKEYSLLASNGLELVSPLINKYDGLPPIPELLEAFANAQPQLESMARNGERAAQALSTINADALHPAIAQRLQQAQPLIPLVAPGLRLLPDAQALAGMKEPRHYLVLVQNNHELRATGGFFTAVGQVTLDQGAIANMEFSDSYKFQRKDVEYPRAPAPMQRYMGLPLMLLRDANWSPDLPTTAQMIRGIYAQETGDYINGLITVDLHAVRLLIDGLGGLTLPGADETLTGANIVDQIKQFFDKPLETGQTLEQDGLGKWWNQRKDFIPQLAAAALARVQGGHLDYVRLGQATIDALNQRAIQVWLNDKEDAQQLAALGWDGALHPEKGADFVALVDSNMGYNKVDSVLERAVAYDVSWPDGADQPAQATLTVTYHHPVTVDDHECDITPRYGASYDDMAARCYFDYVRLYAPRGSQLVRIDGVEADSVFSQSGEGRTTYFAGHFIMQPGATKTVTFVYTLPPEITPQNYRLIWQRQSGSNALPVAVQVGQQEFSTLLENGRFEWSASRP
ncbi:MAG: DUF4012 domain-containing protein [Caldilineaceae bacterium]